VRRHDLDVVSLIAGVVFLALAVIYLVASATDSSIDGRYVWPALLVTLGAGGVAAAVRANTREEQAFRSAGPTAADVPVTAVPVTEVPVTDVPVADVPVADED
jgi:peptidoglycan/LPS O-acetylase OafA/YrhL